MSNPASGTNEAAERAVFDYLDREGVLTFADDGHRQRVIEGLPALATERATGAGIDGLRLLRSDPTLQHECYHGGLDSEGLPSFHVVIDVAILDDLIASLASETPRPGEPR